MSDWQPIETAPKDAKEVLVHNSLHDEQFVCWWEDGRWRYGNHPFDFITLEKGVTHWMPLPPAPETT